MAKHTASLVKDGQNILTQSVTIEETYEPGSQIPTLIGSFYTESWPSVQTGDMFLLALADGRKADIFIQNISSITDGLYMTVFYFSSDLK